MKAKVDKIEIEGVTYVPEEQQKRLADPGDGFVIVRARDAGVHAGTLVAQEGRTVRLRDAVRIYRWRGARTLSEVANSGIDPASKGYTRVAEMVPAIDILDACEVIAAQPEAAKSILGAGWAK